ncbi:transglycosylase SLT domain-containing protein [Hoyosella altamirensis]|uniref:Transglycosylase SLT domain-containing protein n=2 Tax=Hoyosella altamirensis TaxID=616997 RepID=A0A839RTB9_9ACTN|nr:transglycosylase SLT domain-containing protein [Hoyosella altamirensis]MBB3040152.1 hypothetical protein [Hoyosella altamirensis]
MKPPPAEGMFAGVEGIIKLATGGSVDAALDRVKNFMRGEHGKPYQYGGVGNPSWDCSGLWSGIVHVINGRPATSGRLFTTESDFDAMGWRPGLNGQVAIGISRGGGGPNSHMAGTVDGVNAESGGSHGVQWGGAAIGADHSSFNIHYHLPEVGGEFVSGGGGGGGSSPGAFRRMIAGMFDAIVNPIGRMIPDFGDTLPAQLPKAFYEESRSKVRDWILGQAGDGDTGGIVTGSVDGPVREVVNQAFAEHGWHEGAQWDAVDYIVTRESGWNPNAQNPSSSAYGLFQFLDQTWGTVGGRKTSDPYEQGVYGARYMAQRYGDPVSARRFWEANNYYDQGGLAKHIGMMLKNTNLPEQVLSPEQTAAFQSWMDAGAGGFDDRWRQWAEDAGNEIRDDFFSVIGLKNPADSPIVRAAEEILKGVAAGADVKPAETSERGGDTFNIYTVDVKNALREVAHRQDMKSRGYLPGGGR